MATTLWQGGTTAVAQIETFALQNDFNNSETALTMTVTAEDGSTTQTVAIDPSGTDESAIAALWKTALDDSTQTLFTPITWTVSTATVTGTAKIAGVPFYAASSVTGGAGTVTDTVTTASAGPFDYNTTANWSGSAVPSSNDIVFVLPHPTDEKSYDIKYGLDQNAVDLGEFHVGETYDGSIGDSVNSYFLRTGVSGTGAKTILNGRGEALWLKGKMDSVWIRRAINSKDAVHLSLDIDDLYILGPNVQGTITIANSTVLDNIHLQGAPGATLIVGTSVTSFDILEMDSGTVKFQSDPDAGAAINVNGGELTFTVDWTTGAGSKTIEVQKDGTVIFNAGGELEQLNVRGGLFSLDTNFSAALTIAASEQWGGIIAAESGLSNLTWTAATIQHGGEANGDVSTSPQAA